MQKPTNTIRIAAIAFFLTTAGMAYGQDESMDMDPTDDQSVDGTGGQRSVDGTGRQRSLEDGTGGDERSVDGTGDQRSVDGTGRRYTVQAGDTLGSIAAELFGDASKYRLIYQANSSILNDPNELSPGTELVIPAQD